MWASHSLETMTSSLTCLWLNSHRQRSLQCNELTTHGLHMAYFHVIITSMGPWSCGRWTPLRNVCILRISLINSCLRGLWNSFLHNNYVGQCDWKGENWPASGSRDGGTSFPLTQSSTASGACAEKSQPSSLCRGDSEWQPSSLTGCAPRRPRASPGPSLTPMALPSASLRSCHTESFNLTKHEGSKS